MQRPASLHDPCKKIVREGCGCGVWGGIWRACRDFWGIPEQKRWFVSRKLGSFDAGWSHRWKASWRVGQQSLLQEIQPTCLPKETVGLLSFSRTGLSGESVWLGTASASFFLSVLLRKWFRLFESNAVGEPGVESKSLNTYVGELFDQLIWGAVLEISSFALYWLVQTPRRHLEVHCFNTSRETMGGAKKIQWFRYSVEKQKA